MSIREPAVAGTFYPAEPERLRAEVERLLGDARSADPGADRDAGAIRALISPHAGYVYSGAVAARVFAPLAALRGRIRRVVLLGPAHRVWIRGLALPTDEALRTPLGLVPVDETGVARLRDLPQVGRSDPAHRLEHSLEVQLPFLQAVLGEFAVVPLVVGDARDVEVAEVLERFQDAADTLIVVSSDLSHYHDYDTARRLDARTRRAIESCDAAALDEESACGRVPVRGLLRMARAHGLRPRTLDLRSSGDTAGPRDRVVGYGAWLFLASADATRGGPGGDGAGRSKETASRLPDPPETDAASGDRMDDRRLLELARRSIAHGLRTGEPFAPCDAELSPAHRAPGAAFVTLRAGDGSLAGCIGSLEPARPLAHDVARNAWAAASRDPRFPPVTAARLDALTIHISILGEPRPLEVGSRAELLARLVPGRDGLVLEDGGRRATFLPQVWQEVASPDELVGLLWRKAGLPATHWSPTARAWRYATRSVEEARA